MKQELEAEYLATFKKTVAQHEVFLQRIATHPVLKGDRNFHVFLEYESDLNVRSKNTKERLAGIFSSFQKSSDELLLSNTQVTVRIVSFEKAFMFRIVEGCRWLLRVGETLLAGVQRSTEGRLHQIRQDDIQSQTGMDQSEHCIHNWPDQSQLADNYIKLSACLLDIANLENTQLESFLTKLSDTFEKMRRIESRVANDQDLKLSDTLRYQPIRRQLAINQSEH